MDIISINIKRRSANLFLYTFLAYLAVSIFHSHHYNYSVIPSLISQSDNSEGVTDPFLDSSLNCSIHNLNNSISFQIIHLPEAIFTFSHQLNDYQSHTVINLDFYNSNQLRAPPTI